MRVTADELYDLPSLRARFAARLRLEMNGKADAKQLMDVLAPYRTGGACPVFVHYETGAAACDVALGEAWRVRPDAQLIERLGAWLAPENVQVVYASGAA
jgi:DNA polymerase-3 subunit alpha